MYIPKALLALCSDDQRRYALNHIYVNVNEKTAVASNGAMLAKIPIEPEEQEISGLLGADAILHAAKQPKSLKGKLLHIRNSEGVPGCLVNGIWFPDACTLEEVRYPDYGCLFTSLQTTAVSLTLNAELLHHLARVIDGAETIVTLTFTPHTEGQITVTPGRAPGPNIGLLMPYRPGKRK